MAEPENLREMTPFKGKNLDTTSPSTRRAGGEGYRLSQQGGKRWGQTGPKRESSKGGDRVPMVIMPKELSDFKRKTGCSISIDGPYGVMGGIGG